MNVIEKNITLADGRVITLETGKLAKQADGAVMLKMGNTMLLATVVSAQDAGPDVDFMPLSVDYKEKFASATGTTVRPPEGRGCAEWQSALEKSLPDEVDLQR